MPKSGHPARLFAVLLSLAGTLAAQRPGDLETLDLGNGRFLSYHVEGEFAVIQGDILIGRAAELAAFRSARAQGETRPLPDSVHFAISATGPQLWPKATMYYTIDPGTPVPQNLLDAVTYWNQVGQFKILPRTSEANYVTFRSVVTDAACQSQIGMAGGQQLIGVTANCTVGSAIHELGHAWGLLHEQSRPDRGGYVSILYENIDKRYFSDFNVSAGAGTSGYYDYDSIMHYAPSGFARNFEDTIATVPLGIPIGQRTGLSAGDVDGVNRLYGFIPTATTITTTPTGLPITVDGVTANSPQTYTWTPGSSHTVSVAGTQSSGTGPLYKFARWSDGGDLSHTVVASAGVTVYCAQFSANYAVSTGVAAGSGNVSITPPAQNGYLPDRFKFIVTATPSGASQFLRWSGLTYLGASGDSVSATTARVRVFDAASNYQATFTVAPLTQVNSVPPGAAIVVDGTRYIAPVSFAWSAGSTHTLSAPSPQTQGTSTEQFLFQKWQDGSTTDLTVTAGTGPAAYTAMFTHQYRLSVATVGTGTIVLSPTSPDGFYNDGTQVQLQAQPGAGQTLRYWIGDAAGANSTATVTVNQERWVLANFGTALPWLPVNAASFAISPVPGVTGVSAAPGEIISFFGTNIGPSTAQSTSPDASGRLPVSVGGASVVFDKTAAPITYASPNQINVVVPYEIAGQTTTAVKVSNSTTQGSFNLTVFDSFPALFTYDGSGQGPVAAINQDGTINSQSNPAASGSVVVLYGTGAGVLDQKIADGQVTGTVLAHPVAPVFARFGNLAGDVLYAGSAPFFVNGALQVNVKVPDSLIGGGQVPIQLTVGAQASAPGTTIWIQ